MSNRMSSHPGVYLPFLEGLNHPLEGLDEDEDEDEDEDDGSDSDSDDSSFQELQSFYDRQQLDSKRFLEFLYGDEEAEDAVEPVRKRACRTKKKVVFYRLNEANEQIPMTPRDTLWYSLYVVSPNLLCDKFHHRFRLRFRMPYAAFLELLEWAKVSIKEETGELYFRRWISSYATGMRSSLIELMILGSLRYLGRGWTFDDIEEATCVNKETHRQFFAIFIRFGREILFPMFVKSPKTAAEAEEYMKELRAAGFHGALASTDATHVRLDCVIWAQIQSHSSFKEHGCARSYNLTVSHLRRILSTTPGHPCRWNDKTLQIFDPLMRGIDDGTILCDYIFNLFEYRDGNIVSVVYQGVWLLVDNGYLKRATTIPPFSKTLNEAEIKWSAWLESMRKDVECTFGILKGRWRILKSGIRLHGVTKADDIWHTCCALHNWLLDQDGLETEMDGVNASIWEGAEGELGERQVQAYTHESQIDAIRRLSRPDQSRHYDLSGMGAEDDVGRFEEPTSVEEEYATSVKEEYATLHANLQARDSNLPRVVRNLPRDYFRGRLVEHFNILLEQKKVVWPTRNKAPPPYAT